MAGLALGDVVVPIDLHPGMVLELADGRTCPVISENREVGVNSLTSFVNFLLLFSSHKKDRFCFLNFDPNTSILLEQQLRP